MSPFQWSEKAAGVNTDSYTCHCVKGNSDFTQWTQMYGFDTVGSFVLTWGCKAANECVDEWGVSRWTQIPKNNTDTSATTRSLATAQLKRSESFWQCWMTWMCDRSRGWWRIRLCTSPYNKAACLLHTCTISRSTHSDNICEPPDVCCMCEHTEVEKLIWFSGGLQECTWKGTQSFRWSFGLKNH